ncbi:MAG: type IV pilin [Candidatus Aenigmatarchaeota archaeon]
MKGISAVIATLLLLVITIGLAMTAYFYINNIVHRSTSKVITVEPGYCTPSSGGYLITVVITNTGTEPINQNDIKFVLNNNANPTVNYNPPTSFPLPPRGTTVASISTTQSGVNNLIVITPSGSIKQQVFC